MPTVALKRPDRRTVERAAICVVASLSLAVLILVASHLSTASDSEPGVINLIIPMGAAEAVARGETPVSIPAKLQFQPRATVHIQNNDSVPHQLAWLVIPPGGEQVASQSALFPSANRFVCSFHAGGVLSVDAARSKSFGLSAITTILLFGLPLAAAAFGVTTIVSRLDVTQES